MTHLENKARRALKSWVKTLDENETALKTALKLLDVLEPVGRGIHPGDIGEVRALRNDAITDAIEELENHLSPVPG